MSQENSTIHPAGENRDDRKSARIAAERVRALPGTRLAGEFALARSIFRSSAVRQGAIRSGEWHDAQNCPVIFLDGEEHRTKRAAIAKFFTPRAVTTRHRVVMERTTDFLIAEMQAKGGGRLDDMSFHLAVVVAAEIIGLLTHDVKGLSSRIAATLSAMPPNDAGWFTRKRLGLLSRYYALKFFRRDVQPAIAVRRAKPEDDVISDLIKDGCSQAAIMVECMVYASAGMATTREFIVMAAWHMFEKEDLRKRFLDSNEDDQIAILEEILRLEPVASMLYRRVPEAAEWKEAGPVPANSVFAIDIRAVNTDAAAMGSCPHMINPDRAKQTKSAAHMSFGDGAHRCPGAQVALYESKIFLDRLFRIPGIKLVREPDLMWFDPVSSYELRNAVVACEQQSAQRTVSTPHDARRV